MTTISKRDALELAADIRGCVIRAHAAARRHPLADASAVDSYLVGGLEIILGHFFGLHAGSDARIAIVEAMSYTPTEADFAERERDLAARAAAVDARSPA